MPNRYQVRGPHGDYGTSGRWTVVDTLDRNILVSSVTRKRDAVAIARELNEQPSAQKWPTDAEEAATRELVELADSIEIEGGPELSLTAKNLLKLYLDVEAILMRHDVNPRKLRDAMDYLARYGND
jgi:hypothetical protein